MVKSQNQRLAFFLPSLEAGGAERVMTTLLAGVVARGTPTDLVVCKASGPFLAEVPREARLIDLQAPRMRKAVWKLRDYLRQERPAALLSRMNHANITAIVARTLARVETRVVVVEASNVTAQLSVGGLHPLLSPMQRLFYPWADRIVGVSEGVSADLRNRLRVPPDKIVTIYNPTVEAARLNAPANEPLHRFLTEKSAPVFLAVGRLTPAKDFASLLNAFARVLRVRDARLLILGEGELRRPLEEEAQRLGITNRVALPGFCSNPYAAMRQADAFVLSSVYEGLPNALIEALACGCPVVATACPSGPAEILENGRHGLLSLPGDRVALASSMLRSLDYPWDRQALRRRAAAFSLERALPEYLKVLGLDAAGNVLSVAA